MIDGGPLPGRAASFRSILCALVLLVAASGCALPTVTSMPDGQSAVLDDDLVVVAVSDVYEPRPGAGAAPRGDYRRSAGYAGGDQALATARALAETYGLSEVSAWTIAPLRWRCMLYRVPAGSPRDDVLTRLTADPRVQLAQPLNGFETLSGARAYDDPYWPLQTGFAAIDAAGAHRVTRGQGVTVALIDTTVDASHPDLNGRIAAQYDYVGRASAGERHGTEIAGVIAAVANNGIGIAGVAPAARLLALRACWVVASGAPARCNSFTLAQALATAIAAGADIVNLSLGGPRDPLLERLAQYAMARGTIVVGAMPASGRREGFPSALPGVVVAVTSEGDVGSNAGAGAVAAPGERILTLQPGGSYDYASGSSLAAAHVSGAIALMRSIDVSLAASQIVALLAPGPSTSRDGTIDACRAVQRIRQDPSSTCDSRP